MAQRKTPAESSKPNPKRLGMPRNDSRAQNTDAQTSSQAKPLAQSADTEEAPTAKNKRLEVIRDERETRAVNTDVHKPFQHLEPLERLEVIKSYRNRRARKYWASFSESLTLPERLRYPFRLMDLPAEVRTNIFEYALQDCPQHLTHIQLPPLIQVSHQVRSETMPIFFSTTEFLVTLYCDYRPSDSPNHQDWYKMFKYDPGTMKLSPRVENLLHDAGDSVVMRHVKFYA